MKQFVWFLCAALALESTAWAAAEPRVQVHVAPAKIVRRTFDPRNPPKEMPKLTPPEAGQCVYEFGCEMETRIERPARLFGKTVRGRVTGTIIHTRMNVTLWTPANGSPVILEHEEGHRRICEHYYASAGAVARRIGNIVVGAVLTLPARDEAAAQRVLEEFQGKFIQTYLDETLHRCSVAQDHFDAITHHSMARVPVNSAVERAIAEEARAHAQASNASSPDRAKPRARSAPTRPRPHEKS